MINGIIGKKKLHIALIAGIFIIFLFFRFYNFNNRLSFGWDQEQYSTQVRQIIKDHKPVLLGPRTTNDKGFFLAPYFTYLITPFYLLTNLHPYATLIFLIFFNICFFFSSLYLLTKLFSILHALFFLFFWAINPLLAGYDFVAWWPIYIPLGTLLTWGILNQIYKNKSIYWWIILGIFLGLFINMHFQFFFLIIFTLIILIINRRKINFNLKKIFLLLISFTIMFFPLFVFDLRHNFLNFNLFINYFTQDLSNGDRFVWINVFNNLMQPLTYLKSNFISLILYLLIFFLLVYLFKIKKNYLKSFYFSTLILWFLFPIVFAKYGQRPSEYYFIFLYPFIYIIICDFFLSIKKKSLLIILIAIFFMFNFNSLKSNLKSDIYGLFNQDNLIKQLASFTKGKKFNISFTTPLGREAGFRYLIDYYQIKQSGNWNDPLIQIKIPVDDSCTIKSGDIGVIIPKELAH